MAKTNRLTKATIKFISLCPRGANRMSVVVKSEDSLGAKCLISKVTPKGELIACVYAPDVLDSQGDWATADDIREMAHSYLREGGSIDIQHQGVALTKDQAYTAESFVIQKGDPRFADLKDEDGKPIDATGGWGAVLQLVDEELKKVYADGAWAGVSMGGFGVRVEGPPPVKKEQNMALTKDEIADIAKTVATATAEAIKSVLPGSAVKKDEKPFDPTDMKQVRLRKEALAKAKLQEGLDFDNPDDLATYEDRVAKHEEAVKTAKASGQPTNGKVDKQGEGEEQGLDQVLKSGSERGSKMAAWVNKSRGF